MNDRADQNASEQSAERSVERRKVLAWLWRVPVLLAVGGGGFGLYEAIRVHFNKGKVAATPDFLGRPDTRVAPITVFDEEWASEYFALPAQTADQAAEPALAVRLPGPIPGGLTTTGPGGEDVHLAAFSRVCTHQGCIVEMNRDVAAITFGFNYNTDRPAITCQCHLSVFDPEEGGRVVSGPAIRPLPRVRLELRAGELYATGLERSAA